MRPTLLKCTPDAHITLIRECSATDGAYSQSLQWVAYSLHCRLQEGKQFLCDGRERVRDRPVPYCVGPRLIVTLALLLLLLFLFLSSRPSGSSSTTRWTCCCDWHEKRAVACGSSLPTWRPSTERNSTVTAHRPSTRPDAWTMVVP